MKQQFTGSYTLDVASRTIVLSGIEIPPERLTVVINSTVGFVYHNIEHEPVAQVSIAPSSTGGLLSAAGYDAIGGFAGDYTLYQDGLDKGGVVNIVDGVIMVVNPGDGYSAGFANTVGGTRFVVTIDPSYNTVVVFPAYKDCETHQNSDALSIFYDDGVDLGQLIKDESDETQALLQAEFDETQAAITDFRTEVKAEFDATQALLQTEFTDTRTALTDFRAEVKAESDETQTLLQTEFTDTRTALTDFRAEVKAESDETQTLLQTEFDDTRSNLTDFRAEVKAESDETQTILQSEFDETKTLLSDFKTEAKAESDETQSLLQAEFDETQTLLSDFKTEAKAESDATKALLQAEFDETQTLLSDFKTEVKAESDATQTLLGDKLPALAEGMVPTEFLNLFEPPNDVDVSYVPGGYGPSQIVFSKGGVVLKTLNLTYGTSGDSLGKIISIAPAP